MKEINREVWLQKAVTAVTPMFEAAGYKVPTVRVCPGFPSRNATSAKKRRIGECWSNDSATDKLSQIFISPVLVDYTVVLATLIHEMVHAVVGIDAGHKSPFIKCAKALGLTGKWTATYAGEELTEKLAALKSTLGEYPHAELIPNMKKHVQTTRLLKCMCADCGHTVRSTKKWIETIGTPICPCNNESMEVQE